MLDDKILFCTAKEFFRGYPFEVIRIIGKEYAQKFHYHDYVQIWYVKKGKCVHYLNDVEYKFSAGDIFVLPPYIPHQIVSKDTQDIELIGCGFLESFVDDGNNSDFSFLKPFMVKTEDVKPLFTLNGAALKKIENIFDEIIFEYQHKEKYFELYIKANILKMLSVIAREYHKDLYRNNNNMLKYKGIITEVIDYMKEHCKEKIYIQDVCEIADLSPTYFSHVFKYMTGRTFSEYLRFLKIEKAKELLLNNTENKTIGEISSEIGFDDHGYFDRVFKNEVGISPKNFKNFYKFF